MTKGKAQHRLGAPFMALLAFAFFLRILVPAGWMPAHGQVGFVPCPAAAPVVENPPKHGHHAHAAHGDRDAPAKPAQPDHGEKKGCDFAPLGLAWTAPPAAAQVAAPVPLAEPLYRPATLARIGQGLAAPPPPSTGPPIRS